VSVAGDMSEPKSSNPIFTCTKRNTASELHNAKGISRQNATGDGLLSKCFLPDDISHIFGPPIHGDDNVAFQPSSWLLAAIDTVASTQ